jgi:hypothetical protein
MLMTRTAIARFIAAVPLLFSLVYLSQCPNGDDGFVLSLKLGHLSITATSCR